MVVLGPSEDSPPPLPFVPPLIRVIVLFLWICCELERMDIIWLVPEVTFWHVQAHVQFLVTPIDPPMQVVLGLVDVFIAYELLAVVTP